MLVISAREFRDNQKKYLDLVDNNEQVIVQRGKGRAYALVSITSEDKFFLHQPTLDRIRRSIDQVKEGKVKRIEKGDIDELTHFT